MYVNTLHPEALGHFELLASSEAGPVEPGECISDAPFRGGPETYGSGGQGISEVLTALVPMQGHSIELGSDVTGRLTGGDFVSEIGATLQAWQLHGREGQPVTVELIS